MEIKVGFASADEELTAELISVIFQELGANGVVVDDPHLEPQEEWGGDAVARPQHPAVTGYFPVDQRLEERCRRLEKALAELDGRRPLHYRLHYQTIDEQDWAESWKNFFYPEEITPRLVVKPTWRDFQPQQQQQVIEIDPGMAFGTGTHPTTRLCARLMEKYLRPGRAVLDVGTGSGILLIAAAKLGAGQLTGVDLDPSAVAIARSNLQQNRIPPERYSLVSGHLVQMVRGRFDMIVANILAHVIIELLESVPGLLPPGGVFICSGIIQAYRDKVIQRMVEQGVEMIDLLESGEWVAIAGRKVSDIQHR